MRTRRSVSSTIADPIIKFAQLAIDGQTYQLAYSFNSIAVAEQVGGFNLLAGLENLKELTAGQLRGLLYAALILAQPDVTIEQAASLIRLDTLTAVTAALVEAYSLSMPETPANPTAAGVSAGQPAA